MECNCFRGYPVVGTAEVATRYDGTGPTETVPLIDKRNGKCPRCGGTGRVSNGCAERAEYIRLMNPQSSSPDQIFPPNYFADLGSRIIHLAGVAIRQWRGQGIPEWIRITLKRGFIEGVECTLAEWERVGPWLARRHPIQEVFVTDKQPRPFSNSWAVYPMVDFMPPPITWIVSNDLLAQMETHHNAQVRTRNVAFPTQDAARTALSVACIAWARAQPDAPIIPR